MSGREQKNFEFFKVLLTDTISKEEKKTDTLLKIKELVGDKDLSLYAGKRQSFLSFCYTYNEELQKIVNYQGNEKLIDAYQKDYHLTLDSLKKDALKLMAKNQKIWFEKLFTNNFDNLKALMRCLMISETPSELATIERIIQEIELLRFKEGYK